MCYLKLENGQEYKGYGYSTIHWCRNANDWNKNHREPCNSEAVNQFLASNEVPYDVPVVEFRILKRKYVYYK